MPLREELLERDRHFAELAALLAAARGGEGKVALVFGEAGIGKTALLERFAREQATPPVRVFWGGCDDLFTPRPLAPLHEVAWMHGGALSERLRAGAPRDEIFRTFFEELRTPRPPALVVIEDVHWADEATLDLLHFLGRRAERTSALLVFSYRDNDAAAMERLRSVIADLPSQAVRRIPLQPLSPAAVARLAEHAHRSAGDLHAVTGGNPFFVTEVLASEPGSVPATVRDAVVSRAARLSPHARELLDLASVVPSRVEVEVLSAAAGLTFDALDELLSAGILSPGEGTVAFRHQLARRAIEDALPPLRAAQLHARILAALRSLPGEPQLLPRLVHHAQRAHDVAAVLEIAPRAAENAARLGAHREAAAHLAIALGHGERLDPARRAQLLEARSYQCYLTDRMKEGIEAISDARALWRTLGDRTREGDCLRWHSRLCWYAARNDEARRYADLAIETLQTLPAGPELAMAWSNRSQLHMLAGEATAALQWGRKALRFARQHGLAEIEAHALNNIGCATIESGSRSGWVLLEESLRISLQHEFQEHAARAYSNLGSLAVEERLNQIAERWLDEGIAYAKEHELGTIKLCSLVWRARLRAVQGRFAEAADDATEAVEDCKASEVTRAVALHALGLVRVRRGDAGARAALDEALVIARRSAEAERLVPTAAARAELSWLEGDAAQAARECAEFMPLARSLRRPWYAGELAIWMWRGGQEVPELAELAKPYALQIAGDWRAAAKEFERLGCSYDAALACYESDDPKAMLAAVAALDRLEARPAAARLRRRLSELGVRGIPRGPRSARRDHPFDLTAREQEVLAVLSLGLSNAQIGKKLFVSPKTVDHHVSSILEKLDVASRGAAVAEAQRRGLFDGASRVPGEK